MAGDSGDSKGEMVEMGDSDDGRGGKQCGAGRSTAGRIMPVSGVDVAEARLDLG